MQRLFVGLRAKWCPLVRMLRAPLSNEASEWNPGRGPSVEAIWSRSATLNFGGAVCAMSLRKFATNLRQLAGVLRRPIRPRRKSMEWLPSRPGGCFALMREVGTARASLAPRIPDKLTGMDQRMTALERAFQLAKFGALPDSRISSHHSSAKDIPPVRSKVRFSSDKWPI